jgi:pyruvate,water dikinase
MLHAAINAVFASWHSERAVLYRKHHNIDGLLGTAVNVQMMCPSEVSGVMFTANPVSQAGEIIIESAFGLGEAIVLGKVTPDRFVLAKDNLTMTERVISRKEKRVATLAEDGQGQTGGKDDASLTDVQIRDLARLGLRVEAYFKTPSDIEWALSRGQFFLLQSRPIKFKSVATPISSIERDNVRAEEVATLKQLAAPGGTVWSRFNLSEVLPEPTPMTWAIVEQFMSGRGGYGQMYRDLGFDPDPALDDIGIFDLICGRPYCNLSREPRMQFKDMPLEHNFAALKTNPQRALYPQATLNLRGQGPGAFFKFFVRVPFLTLKTWWSQARQQQIMRTFAEQFERDIVPPYLAEVEKASAEDWSKLSPTELLERMNYWIRRTLFDFARDSLKPTALAALLYANLERSFAPRLRPAERRSAEALAIGQQKAQAALRELVVGVHRDEQTDLPAAIRALREGRLTCADFLRRFGHRGSQEMELSRPRWSEDHAALDRMVPTTSAEPDALARDSQSLADASGSDKSAAWQFAWLKLADEAKLMPNQRPAVEAELRRLQKYMSLRETAKHHLMRGYALIRRALVELDRRFQLDGNIFFLTPDDLPDLIHPTSEMGVGDYLDLASKARRRREIALSLAVPTVIFSDDVDAIGRDLKPTSESAMQGVPLSAGVVEAPAWVLDDLTGAQMPHEPYILVCPSTDPAWVPLFVQARGLVMETGGMLSHGAIVAREFGLPAVAGIADVHRRIQTGQRLRIDGATGMVQILH